MTRAAALSTASRRAVLRPADDFYPTPPEAVRPLLRRWGAHWKRCGGAVWEPACGDGAIARLFAAAGFDVTATNLADHGYGHVGLNFLAARQALAPVLVTNPPYNIATDFARHALGLGCRWVALLLTVNFLAGGASRDGLLEGCGLRAVHPFMGRLTLAPKDSGIVKGGRIDFCWYIWQRGWTGAASIERFPVERGDSA